MKNILKKYNLFIFAVLLSLIPVFWVGKDYVIAGGDDFIFLNPEAYFNLSMWNCRAYFLNYNGQIPHLFPFGFFWWFFQHLGLSNPWIQKLWLFLMWLGASLGIVFLAKTFFPKVYKTISFFAIPFYLFNPFNVFIPLTVALRYVHTCLPFALAFFSQGLKAKTRKQRNLAAIAFALTILMATPAFANPANASLLFILPAFYFFYSLWTEQLKTIGRKIIFSLEAMVLFLCLNLYWLIMFFYNLFVVNSIDKIATRLGGDIFRTTAIFEIFRTLGGWGFGKSVYKVHEAVFYTHFRVVFASYFLIFIAFVSIFYVKKYKAAAFFLFVAGIAIFLIKGDIGPWKEIFQYAYAHFSFSKGYREPWTKFTILLTLSLSMLFGFSCAKIITLLKHFRSKIWIFGFASLVGVMIFMIGYPSILRYVIQTYNMEGDRAIKTKIPSYWYQMVNWFKNNDQDGIIQITPRNLAARDYLWETGFSARAPVEHLFLKNPLRYSNSIDNYGLPELDRFFIYFNNFYGLRSANFPNYLRMLGIKYVLQENDILWQTRHSGNYSPGMMHYLLKNPYLEKIQQFGAIDLYAVKDEFYQPIIYLANKIILTNGPAYGFSAWNYEEKNNFVLIKNTDFTPPQTDDFAFARQIFLPRKNPDAKVEQEEFNFEVTEPGYYTLGINLWDNGQINQLPLTCRVDQKKPISGTITFPRDWPVQKEIETVGYNEMFKTISMAEIELEKGAHALTIASPAFKDKNFGAFNYLTLNKYFDTTSPPSLPSPGIQKIDPAKYLFRVKRGGKQPYIINFAQNFDPFWQLFLFQNKKKTKLFAPHFPVNGVNNGWYIDPAAFAPDADYEIFLEYKPQKTFNRALAASIITFVLILSYILKIKIWPKLKKLNIGY